MGQATNQAEHATNQAEKALHLVEQLETLAANVIADYRAYSSWWTDDESFALKGDWGPQQVRWASLDRLKRFLAGEVVEDDSDYWWNWGNVGYSDEDKETQQTQELQDHYFDDENVEEEVHLTLTFEDASALLEVCRRIGGLPQGRRGIFSGRTTSIAEVLKNAGVRCREEPWSDDTITGAISFIDERG